MKDPRYTALAKLLVTHSLQVKAGDKVMVDAYDIPPDFTVEMIRQIRAAGGGAVVMTHHQPVLRAIYANADEATMKFIGQIETARMKGVDCYIGLRGSHNITEMSDVPKSQMELFEKHWSYPVYTKLRAEKKRWVVLRWPTPSMAQNAGMSTEAFEDLYFKVCAGVDYKKMARAAEPLKKLFDKTDRVHIKGPGTDLTFSIKGMGGVTCYARTNVPDGEVFSCPVLKSVNGTLQYNCETLYRGTLFNNIRLVFKDGKAIEATADSVATTRKLNEILDTDPGGRYIGEFAIGFNPFIMKPMKDILFDEKIAGSFHFTPGQSYDENGKKKQSRIHWDMVCIQRKDYGGGEIWFDGKLIRKDGLFVPSNLKGLNPERLGK